MFTYSKAASMTIERYEHPLNEKTRTYLRIESLLRQGHQCAKFSDPQHYQVLFRSLFDLLDIFDQIQLKAELLKDLDKLKLTYANWLNVPGVDQERLQGLLNELTIVHNEVMRAERMGTLLKEDRFLASIRQRFNLPGGTCCFDLPALHFWLHQPLEKRMSDANRWLNSLAPLNHALQQWLNLSRSSVQFKPQIARAGFFQSEAAEANIVRLHFSHHYGVYPMVSGHKNRFAIKFIHFETGQATTQDIEFEVAVCS
jgi:cell division protein ZapD